MIYFVVAQRNRRGLVNNHFLTLLLLLQSELVEILKNMFLPSKKMIKEQLEWLIEHKYMRRDDEDINTFIYMA